jgi:hypothetical protein
VTILVEVDPLAEVEQLLGLDGGRGHEVQLEERHRQVPHLDQGKEPVVRGHLVDDHLVVDETREGDVCAPPLDRGEGGDDALPSGLGEGAHDEVEDLLLRPELEDDVVEVLGLHVLDLDGAEGADARRDEGVVVVQAVDDALEPPAELCECCAVAEGAGGLDADLLSLFRRCPGG